MDNQIYPPSTPDVDRLFQSSGSRNVPTLTSSLRPFLLLKWSYPYRLVQRITGHDFPSLKDKGQHGLALCMDPYVGLKAE